MRPSIGDPEIDGDLFVEGEPLIIYGEPGSGKTNLVLKILKESLKTGMSASYISTEGSLVLERMDRIGILGFESLHIALAYTLSHLARLVSEAVMTGYSIVAVDNINSLYRSEVGSTQRVNEIFLGILAMLKQNSLSGRWSIATAQVRGTEDLEPSGIDLIRFYCKKLARVSRLSRGVRVIEIEGKRYRFKITENDLVFAKQRDNTSQSNLY